jgi:beta-lactamase superfamily II metal-dependent hydrolase
MTPNEETTGRTPDDLCVRVFRAEKGLGNAILLELPDGTCAIIDWGTESSEALKIVLERCRKGIRVVVATHDHADHTVGLAGLFKACKTERIPIGLFAYPTSQLRDRCKLTEARLVADELGIEMSAIGVRKGPKGQSQAQELAIEPRSWQMVVLAPDTATAAQKEVDVFKQGAPAGNATSVIILFAFRTPKTCGTPGAGKVLLTGDATNKLLEEADHVAVEQHLDLHNQLLLVPHHGGVKVIPDWLQQYVHGIAVISGRTDSPHHPKLATLQTLASRTCAGTPPKLYCTSYAQACREAFESRPNAKELHLVRPGPCFGNMALRVPRASESVFESSSDAGENRRRFGWCGNLAARP